MRTGISLCRISIREKPVFITGNPSSHCMDLVFITGISLWELLHRENPVLALYGITVFTRFIKEWFFKVSRSSTSLLSFVVSHSEIWPTLPYCGPPLRSPPRPLPFLKLQKRNGNIWSIQCAQNTRMDQKTWFSGASFVTNVLEIIHLLFSWKVWLYGKIVYIYRSRKDKKGVEYVWE